MPSLIQLHPNRLTITPQREPQQYKWQSFYLGNGLYGRLKNVTQAANFKAVKNPFIISKASKRKMMDSVNSMYVLSKPRKIEMKTKKVIYNYRMSFVTLTLPSQQCHSDVEIKKSCLNQFFVELRKHYGVQNYVWKAELQKNENIHFHIVLDKYVDYQALRRRWNRILNKLNYVKAYQEKMSQLSFNQYHEMSVRYGHTDIKHNHVRFVSGKRCGWSNPNTVDVRSVHHKKDLAIYMAKYIAKENDRKNINELQVERELAFGRSWFRSYSLSKLKFIHKFEFSDVKDAIQYLSSQKEKVKECIGEYYRAFYFNASELHKNFKQWHSFYMFSIAKLFNYPVPYT
jgi:hypothetical protein